MSILDSLLKSVGDTSLVRRSQQALQNLGYRMQGGDQIGRTGQTWNILKDTFKPGSTLAASEYIKASQPELWRDTPEGKAALEKAYSNAAKNTAKNADKNTKDQAAPPPAGFDPKDRSQDPGDGWFWDAADGWKRSGGGGEGPSAEETYAKLRASAKARYDARKKEAEGQFEIARGLFDEIIDNLAKKREEFAQMYDEGQQDILGRTQQERGNLQSSAKMTDRKAANTMRALGIGGSGVLNYFGDLEQQRNKSEGELYSQREKNERELSRQDADRTAWALAAEREANRNLEAARQKRDAARDYGWADYIGQDALIDQNMLDYVQSIQDTANAMALARASASNYQVDPYAANISSFLGALNAPTIASTPQGAAGIQNVNLQEQDPLIKRYLAQLGGSMYRA